MKMRTSDDLVTKVKCCLERKYKVDKTQLFRDLRGWE